MSLILASSQTIVTSNIIFQSKFPSAYTVNSATLTLNKLRRFNDRITLLVLN